MTAPIVLTTECPDCQGDASDGDGGRCVTCVGTGEVAVTCSADLYCGTPAVVRYSDGRPMCAGCHAAWVADEGAANDAGEQLALTHGCAAGAPQLGRQPLGRRPSGDASPLIFVEPAPDRVAISVGWERKILCRVDQREVAMHVLSEAHPDAIRLTDPRVESFGELVQSLDLPWECTVSQVRAWWVSAKALP